MDQDKRSLRPVELAMVRRLEREAAAARAEISAPLCRRVMEAVDNVERDQEAPCIRLRTRNTQQRVRMAAGIAACAAAALVIGVGVWPRFPMADQPGPATVHAAPIAAQGPVEQASLTAEPTNDEAAGETAEVVLSPTSVAVESLAVLTERANPLDELSHDAQLASQMVLAALPVQLAE